MNNSIPDDEPMNDEDITKLFSAQAINMPKGMEKAIFEQAELNLASGVDDIVDTPSVEDIHPIEKPEKSKFMNTFLTGGLAVAATVVLAVVVTPMLLDKRPVAPQASTAPASQDRVQSESAATAVDADSGTVIRNNTTAVAKPVSQRTIQTMTPQSSSDEPAYRKSVNIWINEINSLITNGNEQKARAEYFLFKKQHAERAKRFKPAFKVNQ